MRLQNNQLFKQSYPILLNKKLIIKILIILKIAKLKLYMYYIFFNKKQLYKNQEELASMAFEPQNFCTCNMNNKLRLEDNSMKYLDYLVFTLEDINCNFFELSECLRTIDIIKSPGEFIYAFLNLISIHSFVQKVCNWLEERPEIIERPNVSVSESKDWDQITPINLGTSQINSSINRNDSSFSSVGKQNVSQILEEKQFIVKSVPLEQDQQKISSTSSSRQLIRVKVGEYSSFFEGKLLEDIDILNVTQYEDENKSYLIFSTVMKGDLLFERECVMKSKLSQWLRSQMGQFSMACQTQAHEGIPQSQGIEVEQHHIQEEQQLKVLPKIKKSVKVKKESRKSGKRKE
ncbi:unnamed protein product [Paramecium pentaurelia]|uniref:Uncharacterized protein n=1 Tax=Paramecium pentaurelia TaxID=43138 RepID=A0A8S1WMW9_9CILI|nr:unnamed protein product [Paramecium pentaurelia]